jgi:dephospho-CoA kinase
MGGVVMDCDQIYHELLMQDKSLLEAIGNRFPGCVEDNKLNRKKLAGIVFNDSTALKDLNTITHGAVKAEVLRRLKNAPGGVPLAIDAIGLFEGGLATLCDVTVAITAPEEDRIKRLMARDNLTREQALERMNAQKPEGYFREKCDFVLENSGSAEDFRKKCLVFFQNLPIIKENP